MRVLLLYWLRVAVIVCLGAISTGLHADELNTSRYDIFYGDLNNDGHEDIYFRGKELLILLHGDIATPIVLPAPESFLVTRKTEDFFGYLHPQPTYNPPESYLTLTDADIAALGLSPVSHKLHNGDFNGDGITDILLQAPNSSAISFTLAGSAEGQLPTFLQSFATTPDAPYIGADQVSITIADHNGDGRDDLILHQAGYNDLAVLATASGSQNGWLIDTQEIYPTQHDSSTAVGAIGAQHEVGIDGSANYSISVYTPPGIGGLQPAVSLSYNSNGGNGLVGVGFDIGGLSIIHRCGTNLTRDGFIDDVDFDANDQFCLDGQRLVAVSGVYGAHGTEYRLEHDSNTKIVSYGSEGTLVQETESTVSNTARNPLSFKVWSQGGQITDYGFDNESRSTKTVSFVSCPTGYTWNGTQCFQFIPTPLQGQYGYTVYEDPVITTENRSYEWAATQIADRFGNRMVFRYHDDDGNGEHHITRIDYNHDTGGNPRNSVRFGYQPRPDQSSGFFAGAVLRQTQRLTSITTYADGTAVRRLNLKYRRNGINSITGDSRLQSVQECAGSDCTPATVFSWDVGESGFGVVADNTGNDNGGWQYAMAMDVNGDGRDDLLQVRGGYWRAMLSNGTTLGGEVSTSAQGINPQYAHAVSYNDDNKTDILFPHGDGKWHIYQAGMSTETTQTITTNPFTGGSLPEPVTITIPAGPTFTNINTQIPIDGYTTAKVMDINGDGRVDLLYRRDSTTYMRLMTDSGFGAEQATNISQTLDKTWPLDINGDGLTDIVSSWGGVWRLWLSTGGTQFERKDTPFSTGGHDAPRFGDFNADGLTDVYLAYNSRWYVMLNTGGQFQAPFEAASANTSYDTAILYDDNGDGRDDILYRGNDGKWHVYLSDGRQFKDLNTGIAADGYEYSPRALDITGNGMDDLALAYGYKWHVRLRKGLRPDYLTEIRNGMGVITRFEYAVMTDPTIQDFYDPGVEAAYPLRNINNASYLVSTVEQSDGSGGFNRSRYTYKRLLTHLRGLGSLGFESMTTISDDTGIHTTSVFGHDYVNQKQGVLERVVTTAPNGTVLSDTANQWSVNTLGTGAGIRYQRRLTQTTVTKRDLNNDFLSREVNDYQNYDGYNNVGNIVSKVYNAGGTLLRTTTTVNTYANDGGRWLLGLLTGAEKTVTVPGKPVLTRKSAFEYDTTTGRKTKDKIVDPATGVVLHETRYGEDANGAMQVDSFGRDLAVTVTGPDFAARTTAVSYDSTGRYLTSETNALGHTVTHVYYPDGHLNAGLFQGSTDANGLKTFHTYDSFGRKRTVTTLDGTANAVTATTTFSWCLAGDVDCPGQTDGHAQTAEYRITTRADDGSESAVYIDKLGRELRKASRGLDGRWVYIDYEFDSRGRNHRVSEPYFAGDTVYWTTIDEYDDLDRVVRSTDPDGRTDEVIYNGLAVTSKVDIHGKNQQKVEVRDSLGNLRRVTDNAQNQIVYDYDSLGQLVKVTPPPLDDGTSTTYTIDIFGIGPIEYTVTGTVYPITMTYDSLGRKSSMEDPDKGDWQYHYNGLGQLIAQRNARGEVTCMAYDTLGRMVKRIDNYQGNLPASIGHNAEAMQQCAGDAANPETAAWVYDTAPGAAKGQLHTVTGKNGYQDSYVYDSLGRNTRHTRTVLGQSYVTDTTYDSLNRVDTVTYPGVGHRLVVRHVYNGYGYLNSVRNAETDAAYYTVTEMDARGNITGEMFGNGVQTLRHYQAETGYLTGIASFTPGSPTADIQDLQFNFDKLGNLNYREDARDGFIEHSFYDNLNRLETVNADFGNGEIRTTQVTYDALGNIRGKTGVGTYRYGKQCAAGFGPHAVCEISGTKNTSYAYDANGNMTSGDGRTIDYTLFDKPDRIVKGGNTVEFSYGPDRARYFRRDTVAGKVTDTTTVGGLYEKVEFKDNGTTVNRTEERHYLGGFAVVTIENRDAQNPGTRRTQYLHKDHLGSVTTITGQSGLIVEEFSFDPWGKRRAPSLAHLEAMLGDWASLSYLQQANLTIDPLLLGSNITRKGFTGHEQIDPVGLIHMNGRVYDAEIGRFISADPFVQDTTNLQALNRYSYVENNPLSYTDPSGYFLKKLFKKLGNLAKRFAKKSWDVFVKKPLQQLGRLFAKVPWLQTVVGIVLSIYCPPCGALYFKIMVGVNAAVALANGAPISQVIKGAAISLISSGVGTGIGNSIGTKAGMMLGQSIASGMAAKAQGGKFIDGVKGAVAGMAIGSAIRSILGAMSPSGANPTGRASSATPGASSGSSHNGALSVAMDIVGKIWNLPNTIIGATIGVIGHVVGEIGNVLGFWSAEPTITFGNNAIQFLNNPFTQTATTLGNVAIYRGKVQGTDGRTWDYSPGSILNGHAPAGLGVEEMQHTYQGQVLGPLYFPAHIGLGISAMFSSGQFNNHGWHTRTNVLETCPHHSLNGGNSPSAFGC